MRYTVKKKTVRMMAAKEGMGSRKIEDLIYWLELYIAKRMAVLSHRQMNDGDISGADTLYYGESGSNLYVEVNDGIRAVVIDAVRDAFAILMLAEGRTK